MACVRAGMRAARALPEGPGLRVSLRVRGIRSDPAGSAGRGRSSGPAGHTGRPRSLRTRGALCAELRGGDCRRRARAGALRRCAARFDPRRRAGSPSTLQLVPSRSRDHVGHRRGSRRPVTTVLDLSIIVVSFNACADLDRCLESLHRPPPETSHEIVVVDNASTDASVETTRRRWPAVRIIEPGSNLGFARAVNLGIRGSSGKAVLLLNSDTIVPAGAIDCLLETLERSPEVAVIGPRLVDAEGRAELSFGPM